MKKFKRTSISLFVVSSLYTLPLFAMDQQEETGDPDVECPQAGQKLKIGATIAG